MVTTSPRPTCTDVIKACDKALEAKDKVIEADNKLIKTSKEQVVALTKQVKNGESDNILKNPFMMGAIGASVGLITGNPIIMIVGFLGGIIYQLVK